MGPANLGTGTSKGFMVGTGLRWPETGRGDRSARRSRFLENPNTQSCTPGVKGQDCGGRAPASFRTDSAPPAVAPAPSPSAARPGTMGVVTSPADPHLGHLCSRALGAPTLEGSQPLLLSPVCPYKLGSGKSSLLLICFCFLLPRSALRIESVCTCTRALIIVAHKASELPTSTFDRPPGGSPERLDTDGVPGRHHRDQPFPPQEKSR